MKKLIIVISVLCCEVLFAQVKTSRITYVNESNIELWLNTQTRYSSGSQPSEDGFGLELNSLHGINLFGVISITAGPGIAFNFGEQQQALPIVGQVKWSLNRFDREGPFIVLNAGRNLVLGNFRPGSSAKLGVGWTFRTTQGLQYDLGFFRKSKEFTLNESNNFNLQTESLGISFGLRL